MKETDLSLFEFHDALLQLEYSEGGRLQLTSTQLNLHGHTPRNPSDTDMEIDEATLCFTGFATKCYDNIRGYRKDENGNLYTDEPAIHYEGAQAHAALLDWLRRGVNVFSLGRESGGDWYMEAHIFDMFRVVFTFDSVEIRFDGFCGKAWYEDEKFKKKSFT